MSINIKTSAIAIAISALMFSHGALAVDRGQISNDEHTIEPYEPSTIGYTKDSDDVGFMDFTVSLKYQLFPRSFVSWTGGSVDRLYFAFTGRFGMYVETRHSSPVIGKSYNPKLFWRHITDSTLVPVTLAHADDEKKRESYSGYIDFGYNHESNGQSINSADEYLAALSTAEKPDYANDNLSRGWDYLEIAWKKTLNESNSVHRLQTYLDLRYFLHHGFMQRTAEEYNDWENNPEGKPRKAVNGIAATFEYQYGKASLFRKIPLLANPTISLRYETGYQRPFEYSTFRLELGTQILELPITFWAQHGYNSDLAQYYKKVNSYGVELKMGAF